MRANDQCNTYEFLHISQVFNEIKMGTPHAPATIEMPGYFDGWNKEASGTPMLDRCDLIHVMSDLNGELAYCTLAVVQSERGKVVAAKLGDWKHAKAPKADKTDEAPPKRNLTVKRGFGGYVITDDDNNDDQVGSAPTKKEAEAMADTMRKA